MFFTSPATSDNSSAPPDAPPDAPPAPQFNTLERRLRENGEDEGTIAKYKDIDASLKRLEMKLREGSTLETGQRGHNKVSNLASQLSSKWERKEEEKIPIQRVVSRNGMDFC